MITCAAAVLALGSDFVSASQTLNAAKTATIDYTVQRIGQTSVAYEAQFAKPDKFRIESADILIVGNGTSIVTFRKADKSFDRKPEDAKELQAFFARPERVLIAAFFDREFSNRFARIAAAGKKTRKGVVYDTVTGSADGFAYTFYIDPAANLTMLAEVSPEGSTDLSQTTIAAVQDVHFDASIAEANFVFTPPAGATDVSADAPLKVPRSSMPNLYGWKVLQEVGNSSCCPTATADGLAWLSLNGFDGLANGGSADERADWIAHALLPYYKTDNTIGTTWDNLFIGLPTFLKDRGYAGSTVAFYSWEKNPDWRITHLGTTIPDLETIQRANARDAFVMLAIGWFNNPDASGKATRDNWHWATVSAVNPSEGTVTIHDPFQKDNPQALPLTLRYTKMPASTNVVLAGSSQFGTKDVSGAGIPVLEHYPNVSSNQFAIVEGVLVVRVAK